MRDVCFLEQPLIEPLLLSVVERLAQNNIGFQHNSTIMIVITIVVQKPLGTIVRCQVRCSFLKNYLSSLVLSVVERMAENQIGYQQYSAMIVTSTKVD